MRIHVTSDLDATIRELDELQRKQVPFATSLAINWTAQRVKDAERAEMARVFDRPSPWTLNSVFMKAGTKTKPEARVWLKDETAVSTGTPSSKYLLPQIEGGDRALKGFERMLQRVLAIPAGWRSVPGEKADLDAFGNISRGQLVKILAYFRTFGTAGFTANTTSEGAEKLRKGTRTRRGESYFAALPGKGRAVNFIGMQGRSAWKKDGRMQNLQPGIYRKTFFGFGASIEPIIIFVPAVSYRKRFDFHDVARRVVEVELPRQFNAALAKALATAR